MFGQERNLWNPWRELDRFQDEVNGLFTARGQQTTTPAPHVNVWTNEEAAWVTAVVPGVAADSLDISVIGETLMLRGQRKPVALKDGEAYHRRERPTGAFARSVQLPFRVDAHKVVAQCKHGVLEVMLPRAAEDKPKRIAIKAS